MTRTYPVSVCIITFNEESRIRDCLESVKWADEIIVVDSFSTDKTVDICKEYTEHVYRRAWGGNIDQKNHTIGLATKDWLLCLDADERLSPELTKEIQNVLKSRETADGFFFPDEAVTWDAGYFMATGILIINYVSSKGDVEGGRVQIRMEG